MKSEDGRKKGWVKRGLIVFCVSVGVWVVAMFAFSFFSKPPTNLGVRDARLAKCGDTPNCVSTQCDDETKQMDPMRWTGKPATAMDRLAAIVASMPGAVIVSQKDDYLRAEFTSSFFRFVDDVEFYVDSKAGVIQFRSASRAGYSDMGVNRNRMTEIVKRFDADS